MTPETFTQWLADMRSAGITSSDAHAGRLLGISANSIVGMKRNGTDHRTALACSALLNGLKPYNPTEARND